EGRDARVLFGSPGSSQPIVLSSATNTLSDAIPGVTLNLLGTSVSPVTIGVARDPDSAAAALKSFADGYNSIADRIAELTKFDATTSTRGILLGDSTVEQLQFELSQLVNKIVPGAPRGFDRLSSVGITVTNGGELSFDEDRFQQQYAADPQ